MILSLRVLALCLLAVPEAVVAQEPLDSREAQARQYARTVNSILSGRALRRPGKVGDGKLAMAALDQLIAFDAVAKTRGKRIPNRKRARAARRKRLDTQMSLPERGAALRQIARAYQAMRGRQTPFTTKVAALCAQHQWRGKSGLRKEEDVLRLLGVLIEAHRLQTRPPEQLRAHPTAAHFPGAVGASQPRVQRAFTLDTKTPRWHSTGLYAAPGEVVEVQVGELPAGVQLDVIVGCHTDNIARRPVWQRFPRITRRYQIKQAGIHKVANAFGGLIYLLSNKDDVGVLRGKITGAVVAPRFVLGETSEENWQSLRALEAPFGELQCDGLILTVPSKVLRRLDDPVPLLRFWAKVVAVQDDLAHYQRTRPERFVFDRQISNGYMHAGYPLMGPVSAAAKAMDLSTLERKGNWGMFHELGHNHQTVHYGRYANPWTFDRNIEVTVNLFSSYTYVAALAQPKAMGHQHWRSDLLADSVVKVEAMTAYASRPPRQRCLFWVHLIHEFGWDTMHKMMQAYAEMPRADWPRTDLAKRSLLLRTYSRLVGHDLRELFASWGLATDTAAQAAAARLPRYKLKVAL